MHIMLINGSPRTEKLSNTDKILTAFAAGLAEEGATFERYAVSVRGSWSGIREAYEKNSEILLALPLFVENVPGLLLEFLETLPKKNEDTRLSFILQSGFAEASQLRCGEKFLEKLAGELGVRFGGTLLKGDNFGLRLSSGEEIRKLTGPYREAGRDFVRDNGFTAEKIKAFAGPEYFPLPIRLLVGLLFRTTARKKFAAAARAWGCTVPIDDRPWEKER